jgi:hypothetical protein
LSQSAFADTESVAATVPAGSSRSREGAFGELCPYGLLGTSSRMPALL